MGKNIILCADGTGNVGGTTPDTNVYKTYNAIEIHNQSKEQITFYDDGVGTAKNKYWRAISGVFGFGFRRNVCDLYEFLAKNYEPGDNVFLFGFSRGAAEVRALSGFIAASGLVDGRNLDYRELRDRRGNRIAEAYRQYKEAKEGLAEPSKEKGTHGAIPIKFIGVWDTVSALGFPQHWKVTSIGMWVLNGLFMTLDRLFDFWIFAHRFYNYELTPNVEYAYHALAVDDERLSFDPRVWDETRAGQDTTVEQVWFAGAHSNVGGGYGRAGLANVPLEWMMERASHHGLVFKKDVREEISRDANVHGRLYDSRDGIGVYYRYQAREIQRLCGKKLRGRVKIDRMVLERMKRKTAHYAPGHLPDSFDVVETPVTCTEAPKTVEVQGEDWKELRRRINKWVFWRQRLYGVFLEFTLLVVISAWWFWVWPPLQSGKHASQNIAWSLHWWMDHIADVLNYVLPVFFEGLITVAVIQHPIIFGMVVAFLFILWALKKYFLYKNINTCQEASKLLVAAYDNLNPNRTKGGSQ